MGQSPSAEFRLGEFICTKLTNLQGWKFVHAWENRPATSEEAAQLTAELERYELAQRHNVKDIEKL